MFNVLLIIIHLAMIEFSAVVNVRFLGHIYSFLNIRKQSEKTLSGAKLV